MKLFTFQLFFLTLFMASGSSANAQNENTTGDYYISLKVRLSFKKEGILSEIEMNIGKNTSHPFHGHVTNIDHEQVSIHKNGFHKIFTNELDLMGYLKSEGWELISTSQIKVASMDYVQYLFYKSE